MLERFPQIATPALYESPAIFPVHSLGFDE